EYDKAVNLFNKMKNQPEHWKERDHTYEKMFVMHGKKRDTQGLINSFNEMIKLRIEPTHLTFYGLAKACLIGEDKSLITFFEKVVHEYGIIITDTNCGTILEMYTFYERISSVIELMEKQEKWSWK